MERFTIHTNSLSGYLVPKLQLCLVPKLQLYLVPKLQLYLVPKLQLGNPFAPGSSGFPLTRKDNQS